MDNRGQAPHSIDDVDAADEFKLWLRDPITQRLIKAVSEGYDRRIQRFLLAEEAKEVQRGEARILSTLNLALSSDRMFYKFTNREAKKDV